MIAVVLVVLGLIGFVLAAGRFGADSRSLDSRQAHEEWPGIRHCS